MGSKDLVIWTPCTRVHLLPSLTSAKVEEVLGDVKGVVVEDNTFSVSVHYRMVAEGEDRERVNKQVRGGGGVNLSRSD